MKTKDQLLLEQAYDMTKNNYSKLSDGELLETYKELCDKRFNDRSTSGTEEANNTKLRDVYKEIKKRGLKLVNQANNYESYSREMER